eukprot:Opistho-2@40818
MSETEKSEREKKELSKNLMAMKFMQRKHEADLKRQYAEQQQKAIDESHWKVEVAKQEEHSEVAVEVSATDLHVEALTTVGGRRSFGNFNPVVEKLTRQMDHDRRMRKADEFEEQETVGEDEMAHRYKKMRTK